MEKEKSVNKIKGKLFNIQQELKVPKQQDNDFGGYKFRSCEDILEAVKPILKEQKCILTLNDEIINIGTRFYIKAKVTLIDLESEPNEHGVEQQISNNGYAREEETKKGMDGSQITGSSSSYARKYALSGLFLLDDVKDSDATNNHGKEEAPIAKLATESQIAMLTSLYSKEEIITELKALNKQLPTELTISQASALIKKKKGA